MAGVFGDSDDDQLQQQQEQLAEQQQADLAQQKSIEAAKKKQLEQQSISALRGREGDVRDDDPAAIQPDTSPVSNPFNDPSLSLFDQIMKATPAGDFPKNFKGNN